MVRSHSHLKEYFYEAKEIVLDIIHPCQGIILAVIIFGFPTLLLGLAMRANQPIQIAQPKAKEAKTQEKPVQTAELYACRNDYQRQEVQLQYIRVEMSNLESQGLMNSELYARLAKEERRIQDEKDSIARIYNESIRRLSNGPHDLPRYLD